MCVKSYSFLIAMWSTGDVATGSLPDLESLAASKPGRYRSGTDVMQPEGWT